MRRILPVFVAGLVCCCPASAGAQAPTQDSVTGVGAVLRPDNGFVAGFDISASSAPGGENPTGHVQFTQGRFPYFGGPVTCLAVNGHVATMNLDTDGFAGIVTLEVTDSPSGDLMRAAMDHRSPGDCTALGTAIDLRVTSGDVTVIDAQPPSTYAQCRQAGWARYGYASRAECINGVHQFAREKCIFERAAHGITAFRAKYGLGPDHEHAMRRCVRLYTGF
jgi:hypothetical protein